MFAGDNTGMKSATTTVINCGNAPLDSFLKGINMTSVGDTIDVDNIKWCLEPSFDYASTGTPLTTGNNPASIYAPKATTTNHGVDDDVYWGIGIPPTSEADTYDGENTFTAIVEGDLW